MNHFIPKPYKKESVTVRIDVDKLEKIDLYSSKYEVNRSEFINRCIDYAMQHMIEFEVKDKGSGAL